MFADAIALLGVGLPKYHESPPVLGAYLIINLGLLGLTFL